MQIDSLTVNSPYWQYSEHDQPAQEHQETLGGSLLVQHCLEMRNSTFNVQVRCFTSVKAAYVCMAGTGAGADCHAFFELPDCRV